MNYRRLLVKYMRLVAQMEGTTFVSSPSDPSFTDDEWEALLEIDKEVP